MPAARKNHHPSQLQSALHPLLGPWTLSYSTTYRSSNYPQVGIVEFKNAIYFRCAMAMSALALHVNRNVRILESCRATLFKKPQVPNHKAFLKYQALPET